MSHWEQLQTGPITVWWWLIWASNDSILSCCLSVWVLSPISTIHHPVTTSKDKVGYLSSPLHQSLPSVLQESPPSTNHTIHHHTPSQVYFRSQRQPTFITRKEYQNFHLIIHVIKRYLLVLVAIDILGIISVTEGS